MAPQQLRSPLDGIRVLDFTNMLSGPYCTRLLADLGAEVLKVEPVEGDHNRGRRPTLNGHSRFFGHLNCGKKSVVLNLKEKAGLGAALRLVAKCDVVVENWRPGVAARLGVGYEAVRLINPAIVYCSISGFGQEGPHAQRPAYAPILHAASGFDLAQLEHQGGDKPAGTATFTADVFGGMSAFAAIQSALLHRFRSGEGQFIDVALLDGMLNILVSECQEAQTPVNMKVRVYPPLKTLDGFIVVAPTSQKNFEAMTKVVDHPEWVADSRFSVTSVRERNWAELMTLVEAWTCVQTSETCEQAFLAQGVPCTRYQTVAQAIVSPQVRSRGALSMVRDAAGEYMVPNAPFKMPGLQTHARPEVPALGAHTHSVLTELLGLSPQEIGALSIKPILANHP